MSAVNWPAGFPRTDPVERGPYPHGFEVTRVQAFRSIRDELQKLDPDDWRIETAAPHTQDEPWRPYHDRDPEDPGVVAYWTKEGEQLAAPCDRWTSLRDNARCIALYLDAKRAIGRYGVSTTEGEFATAALPGADEGIVVAGDGTREEPHEILGVAPDADPGVIKAAARELKKQTHPDNGGSYEDLQRVRDAEEAMLDG